MRKVLIIRFSAMGDVAMLVPVVKCLATQHPDTEFTVLTRKHLTPLYGWMPDNVKTMGIDLNKYKKIAGLNRLYRELKAMRFDAVADVHDVLRTMYLRWRFRLGGAKVSVIDKDKASKKRLLGHGIDAKTLTLMTTRYAQVFHSLGLDVSLQALPCFSTQGEDFSLLNELYGEKKNGEHWIGIAPFAAHPGKIYPLEKMHQVAQELVKRGCRVFLFGAGKSEKECLSAWADGKDIVSTCGQLGGLHNEMLLMSRLDAMLAMDSANMHIAAIVGIPIVSVWGATHPKTGFTAWQQPISNIIQRAELECRPCSIYGKKPCQFGDLRCMALIKPEDIIDKIIQVIGKEN